MVGISYVSNTGEGCSLSLFPLFTDVDRDPVSYLFLVHSKIIYLKVLSVET